MFVEHEYMIIKKISVLKMYRRKVQFLVLSDPDNNYELIYSINFKINIEEYKKFDKVRVKLGVSRKGTSNNPHYYVKSLERVIFKNGELTYV